VIEPVRPEDDIPHQLALYAERIDAADFDGVGELFAHGELCAGDGPAFARGAAEVAAFYRSTVRLHDGSPRTKHLVANLVIDGATARSSYLVLQQVGDGPLQTIITGRYEDRFVPAPDGPGWRFEQRRFFVDLVGDLSQHLTHPAIVDPDARP
jgi:hypothetical protein